jgi:hypothetical protein
MAVNASPATGPTLTVTGGPAGALGAGSLAAAATVSFDTADATRWPFTTVLGNKLFMSGAGDTEAEGFCDAAVTTFDADFDAGTAACFTGGAGVVDAVPLVPAAFAAVGEVNPTDTSATMTATDPTRDKTRIPASELQSHRNPADTPNVPGLPRKGFLLQNIYKMPLKDR